jgi:hypothetical protein
MKRAFYIAAVVLLIARLNATANAQNSQETSVSSEAKPEERVKVEYDRFQDKTFVVMTPTFLTVPTVEYHNDPFVKLAIGVVYSSPGIIIKRPETASFVFTSSAWGAFGRVEAFEKSKGIYLLIDGSPYPLGDVSLIRAERNEASIITRTYGLEVPFKFVEMIATGKKVEMRAGSVETTLNENIKSSFRRLIEIAPKKENPAPAKAVPRPKPTHTFRRRKRP